MAKKAVDFVKLQIPAGKANPAPPVGTALGPKGINIMGFCKEFNARTQGQDTILPVEIKNGKKVTVERKVYPGYVLVEMQVNQESLHVINSIQGVIKFVGKDRAPQPLRPEEVNRLLGVVDDAQPQAPKEEIPFLIGQAVAITDGPFTDFNGTVEEVMVDKGKVRVSVSLFGRPTSVELDYLQLKGY